MIPQAEREAPSPLGGQARDLHTRTHTGDGETVPPSTDMHEGDAPRCLACHRPLTRPASVARGFGPRCHARVRNLTVAILAAGGSVVIP